MNFIHPYLLWGLLAVSIPVIIHLFNFRKFKKVYFTNVRFIRELKQQTQKQSQLRHLVVLLMRMLAIASLVLAFAQPYIPAKEVAFKPQAENTVSIYIDNSFSMEAESGAGSLLDAAKNKAREIASAYRSSDQFQLLSNDFEGRQQRLISQEEFLDMVDELTVTPASRSISEVLKRQFDLLGSRKESGKSAYLISDFQQSIADFENVPSDSSVLTWLVPIQAVGNNNLYIDSCWFISPVHQLNQGVNLVVRVKNDSETEYEKIPVKLVVNGVQKALASFDVAAGSWKEIEMPFTNYESGKQYGMLEITDFPVTYDDRFYIVYNVAESIPVLSINGDGESVYLNSLFERDSAFRFVNNPLNRIDYDMLQQYELIILDEIPSPPTGLMQELNIYVNDGGSLLVIPPEDADLEIYRQWLTSLGSNYFEELVKGDTKVSEIDMQHPLFNDVFEKVSAERASSSAPVDLPSATAYYRISNLSGTRQMALMKLLDGSSFLTVESSGKGSIYLLSVPLDEAFTNFPRHAVFVPVLYKMALLSAATDPLFYTTGKDQSIELSNYSASDQDVFKIASLDEQYEFIPEQQSTAGRLSLDVHNQIRKAGHYRLFRGDETLKGLAFNYDRRESVMSFYSAGDLSEKIDRSNLLSFKVLRDTGKPVSESIKEMNQGLRLWKLFIILALLFLAAEVVLLRIWR